MRRPCATTQCCVWQQICFSVCSFYCAVADALGARGPSDLSPPTSRGDTAVYDPLSKAYANAQLLKTQQKHANAVVWIFDTTCDMGRKLSNCTEEAQKRVLWQIFSSLGFFKSCPNLLMKWLVVREMAIPNWVLFFRGHREIFQVEFLDPLFGSLRGKKVVRHLILSLKKLPFSFIIPHVIHIQPWV